MGILHHHLDDDDHQCHVIWFKKEKKVVKKTTNIRTTLDTFEKERKSFAFRKKKHFVSFIRFAKIKAF